MEQNDINKYGVPEQKKFPLDSADHVRSAVKFFNYVSPKYEEQLANAILRRARVYGVDISEINVGDDNRFKKYLPEELKHYGILGQKWGVRRFENEDGTLTEEGKRRYYKNKKYLKFGAKIVASILISYGAYKISTSSKFKKAIYKGMRTVNNKNTERYGHMVDARTGRILSPEEEEAVLSRFFNK